MAATNPQRKCSLHLSDAFSHMQSRYACYFIKGLYSTFKILIWQIYIEFQFWILFQDLVFQMYKKLLSDITILNYKLNIF